MQGKPKVTKTWREWDAERIGGIKIIDPDGFRTGDPMGDRYVWTRDEFLARRMQCTVSGVVSPLRKVEKDD